MAVSPDFQSYVLEQLAGLGGLSARRMFGGVGLYHDALFFALIDDDTLYFKVDAANREDYTSRGMRPFCPFPDKPAYEMGYYEVPADVLEDAVQLAAWARKSCQVALSALARKPVRKVVHKVARKHKAPAERRAPTQQRPIASAKSRKVGKAAATRRRRKRS